MPLRHPFTMNHEPESVGVEPHCGSTRLLLYVDSHLEPCDVTVPVSLYTTYNGTSYNQLHREDYVASTVSSARSTLAPKLLLKCPSAHWCPASLKLATASSYMVMAKPLL